MDRILFIVFLSLSTIAIGFGGLATYFAVRCARKNDGEVRMALWSVAALAGFSFGGMCWAYFLLPIILHHLSN
ncbi:MAG: hypothetical protein HY966_01660 [Ignavibacteriales bacterium]|nr:hypothetical protein [Ignavibacteriales bacterium]